jgi:GTP pyrophosphokinase
VHALGLADLEELYMEIGFGKVSPRQAIAVLLPEETVTEEKRDESILKKVAKKIVSRSDKGGVRIKGVDDIMIHFSKCCTPVPGDSIVGFITRGKGVSIHSTECPNIYELEADRERIIKVEWDIERPTSHPAKISVLTVDKPGLLANVSTAIAAADSNISNAEITTTEDKRAVCNFVVQIMDTKHLERVMQKVGQVDGVISVKRIKTG